MSSIVHEVRHFVVREGEGVAVPSHEDLAAEAQRLAKGGHVVSMTVPGGSVVQVGPDEDTAEVTERFQKAVKVKAEDDETKSRRGRT